ncbi:MAG: tail fiber domain-containing protein [Pseudomonadota bacterium]|nr:tail fiber domain-containing protein [Pseudomonadota bacterium]
MRRSDFSWVGGLHAITRPGNAVGDGTCAANSGDANGDEGTFVWADTQGIDFVSSGADQFLIRAEGGVAINSAIPAGNALRVNGMLRMDDLGGAGGTGICCSASLQLATCSSSIRYKDHISDLDLGLALIEQMRPVGYEWKGSHQPDIGFVAEEIAELDERLITRNAKGEVEGVKYERLTAVLAGVVQELAAHDEFQAQNMVKLRETNAELHVRLDAIEQRLSTIGR